MPLLIRIGRMGQNVIALPPACTIDRHDANIGFLPNDCVAKSDGESAIGQGRNDGFRLASKYYRINPELSANRGAVGLEDARFEIIIPPNDDDTPIAQNGDRWIPGKTRSTHRDVR
jgi:hypothetical protein